MAELSTKPYLIRAIHQWCEDSGYRPYLAVLVDERTQVPREFVRNGEIVLNVSAVATNRLVISNDLIEFEARFSGSVRQVSIPIENVSAIYAQETGHGMAFDVPKPLAIAPERGSSESGGKAPSADKAPAGAAPKSAQRPKLVPPPAQRGQEPAADTPDSADTTRPDQPQDALPGAGSAPVLQAVESAPTGRAARSAAAPKSRRRGKLSAVPDAGEPGTADAASTEPASKAPDSQAASLGTDAPSPSVPPDEPPPSPPTRPQLKRVK